MRLTALVHSVEKDAFFTVVHKERKLYFYLQKNLIKKFYKYLQTSTSSCTSTIFKDKK